MYTISKPRLNQSILNDFMSYLKHDKYPNVLLSIKLEYLTYEDGSEYIYLLLIKILKSQQRKGYGTLVMKDIIEFANTHNVQIKLWATNIFGVEVDTLIKFYEKLGFIIDIHNIDGYMVYNSKPLNLNL